MFWGTIKIFFGEQHNSICHEKSPYQLIIDHELKELKIVNTL